MKKLYWSVIGVVLLCFIIRLLAYYSIIPWNIGYNDVTPWMQKAMMPGKPYIDNAVEYPVIIGLIQYAASRFSKPPKEIGQAFSNPNSINILSKPACVLPASRSTSLIIVNLENRLQGTWIEEYGFVVGNDIICHTFSQALVEYKVFASEFALKILLLDLMHVTNDATSKLIDISKTVVF